MIGNTGRSGILGLAFVAIAAIGMTTTAPSARADHFGLLSGTLVGSVIGGALGSTIGKGSGRDAAIGAGAVLGGLYGHHLAGYPHVQRRPRPGSHVHYYYPPPPRRAVVTYHLPAYPISTTRPANTENFVSMSGSSGHRAAPAPLTECRTLEGGLAPVYACRSARGDWRILR